MEAARRPCARCNKPDAGGLTAHGPVYTWRLRRSESGGGVDGERPGPGGRERGAQGAKAPSHPTGRIWRSPPGAVRAGRGLKTCEHVGRVLCPHEQMSHGNKAGGGASRLTGASVALTMGMVLRVCTYPQTQTSVYRIRLHLSLCLPVCLCLSVLSLTPSHLGKVV